MERQTIKHLLTARYVLQHLSFYTHDKLLMASSHFDKQICIGHLNSAHEAKLAAKLLNDALLDLGFKPTRNNL